MPKLLFARPPLHAAEERQIRKLAEHGTPRRTGSGEHRSSPYPGTGCGRRPSPQRWGCSSKAVRYRLARFAAEGPDGLGDRPGVGRRPWISQAQRSQLIALAASLPPGQLIRDGTRAPTARDTTGRRCGPCGVDPERADRRRPAGWHRHRPLPGAPDPARRRSLLAPTSATKSSQRILTRCSQATAKSGSDTHNCRCSTNYTITEPRSPAEFLNHEPREVNNPPPAARTQGVRNRLGRVYRPDRPTCAHDEPLERGDRAQNDQPTRSAAEPRTRDGVRRGSPDTLVTCPQPTPGRFARPTFSHQESAPSCRGQPAPLVRASASLQRLRARALGAGSPQAALCTLLVQGPDCSDASPRVRGRESW
jgi:hypothetical protein